MTWGNGTNGTPLVYDAAPRQLASWGFAVIDSCNPQTGSGIDILAGTTYLARRADAPAIRCTDGWTPTGSRRSATPRMRPACSTPPA